MNDLIKDLDDMDAAKNVRDLNVALHEAVKAARARGLKVCFRVEGSIATGGQFNGPAVVERIWRDQAPIEY